MLITRRLALLSVTALLPLGLAACPGTPVTPPNVAAAIAALQGVIASVQAMVTAGGLTPDNLIAAQQQIAALQAQITVLTSGTSASTQTTIAMVFDNVTEILGQMAQYLPLILSVVGMLARPGAPSATPTQAALRTHYGELRTIAGR